MKLKSNPLSVSGRSLNLFRSFDESPRLCGVLRADVGACCGAAANCWAILFPVAFGLAVGGVDLPQPKTSNADRDKSETDTRIEFIASHHS